MIVGVTGKARSGKGVVSAVLARELGLEQVGFSDLLKWSAARLFFPEIDRDAAIKWADEFKMSGDVVLDSVVPEERLFVSGRQFLQRYGTEAHRELMGVDFWVERAIRDGIVLTDVRFDNEAEAIHRLGGHVIEVYRPGANGDGHSSEMGIEEGLVDWTIRNTGSLTDLQRTARLVSSWIKEAGLNHRGVIDSTATACERIQQYLAPDERIASS